MLFKGHFSQSSGLLTKLTDYRRAAISARSDGFVRSMPEFRGREERVPEEANILVQQRSGNSGVIAGVRSGWLCSQGGVPVWIQVPDGVAGCARG